MSTFLHNSARAGVRGNGAGGGKCAGRVDDEDGKEEGDGEDENGEVGEGEGKEGDAGKPEDSELDTSVTGEDVLEEGAEGGRWKSISGRRRCSVR